MSAPPPTGCFKCGRPGHWSRDCPSAPASASADPAANPSRFASSSSYPTAKTRPPSSAPPPPEGDTPQDNNGKNNKKKKRERATRPKLTPDLLLSDDGIGFVLRYFPKAFKPRARPGHEVEDLGNLIKLYTDWHSRLIPYYSFEQFVRKLEKVGAGNRVRRCISELRDRVARGGDPTVLHEAPSEEVTPAGEPGRMDDISNSHRNQSTNEDRSANYNSTRSYDPSYSDIAESSHSPPNRLRGCSKFNSQFSLSKMIKLISKLTKDQIDIVSKCGFRSLLCLKCSSMPNSLVIWLAMHYDPKSRCVKAPGGTFFRMDAPTAHQILGIPFTGNKVPSKSSRFAKDVILKDTNQSNQGSKIDDLLDMVNPDLVGDRFARVFFLIVLGVFLCPSSNTRVSHHYYEAIHNVSAIKKYDWCSEVVQCLHMGIIKFHTNLSKANTSGTATLPGCVFLLVAAYYDYLVVGHDIVHQTIPRICVWNDKAIYSYREAEIQIEHIEFKGIEATLFTSDHMDPNTYRGFNEIDLSGNPLQQPGHASASTSDEKHEAPADERTPPTKTSNFDGAKSSTINFESARKVMPDASLMSLRVLWGEVTHPDVDSFIKSTLGNAATTEIHKRIHSMCQNFFKDSVQQYIKSIEPLLVSQSCDMVKSFWAGLQESKTENVPATDAPASEFRQQETHNHTSTTASPVFNAEHHDAFSGPSTDPSHYHIARCAGCNNEIPIPGEHICSALVVTNDINTKPISAAHSSSGEFLAATTGEMSGPPPISTANSADQNSLATPPRSSPLSQVDRTPSSKTPAPHDDHVQMASCSQPKRNLSFQDEVITHLAQSPKKKMKSLSISSAGQNRSNHDVVETHSDQCNDTTAANKGSSKKTLSQLGHRKRALKEPLSLLQGERTRPSKLVISKLDQEIYHLCTKRINSNTSPDCVRIGRMSIGMKEFGDTMRAKKWVGTFVMNVYSEALMYDQSEAENPKIKKGFLTSAEVDHMKVNGISVHLLQKKLSSNSIGFDLNKVEMVMIPVLHGYHWWLVVANIRDQRFDVLSSMPFTDETRGVTDVVITNFVRTFDAMHGPQSYVNLQDFKTSYHRAPQQNTNVDCGIFVMNFMSSWDGRRVASIDNSQIYNYRVQAAVYLIRHKANEAIPASVKKLIEKHEGQNMKKNKESCQ